MGGTRFAVTVSFTAGLLLCAAISAWVVRVAHGPASCLFDDEKLKPFPDIEDSTGQTIYTSDFLSVVVTYSDSVVAPLIATALSDLRPLLSQTSALHFHHEWGTSQLGLWQLFLEENAMEVEFETQEESSSPRLSERIFVIDDWLIASSENLIRGELEDIGQRTDASVLVPVCKTGQGGTAVLCEQPFVPVPAYKMTRSLSCCIPSSIESDKCAAPETAPSTWPCTPLRRRVCRAVPAFTEEGDSYQSRESSDPWAACFVPWPLALSVRSIVSVIVPSDAVAPLYIRGFEDIEDTSGGGYNVGELSGSFGRCQNDSAKKFPVSYVAANGYLTITGDSLFVPQQNGFTTGLLTNAIRISSTQATVGATTIILSNNWDSIGADLKLAICNHVVAQVASAALMLRDEARALSAATCTSRKSVVFSVTAMLELERRLSAVRIKAAKAALQRACASSSLPNMIAPPHVIDALARAWGLLTQALISAEAGESSRASLHAQHSRLMSEIALADSDVTWDQYLSLWHTFAIYAPPWGPIIAPVTLGLVAAVQQLLRQRKFQL